MFSAFESCREALLMAILLSAPLLLAALAAGFLGGLLQAITQIQDMTIPFVIRLAATIGALAVAYPWLSQMMAEYASHMFGSPSLGP